MNLSVVCRVDASSRMGSGHVVRCLTLAEELRRRGASVTFICREHAGHMIAVIEQSGFEVLRLPAPPEGAVSGDEKSWLGAPAEVDARQSLAALAGRRPDWLIVDHYCIDASWQRELRRVCGRVLVIDDLANRLHEAEVLVDQSLPGAQDRYANRVPATCRRLLGPRYALLQSLYAQLRRVLPDRDGRVRRVLLFFGAHDPSRSALRVLEVLGEPEFTHLAVDVVPGSNPQLTAEIRQLAAGREGTAVHENLPGLAALFTRADLAIGAGGGSTWERACCALPALVTIIADNQAESARALASDGAISLVGLATALSNDDWRRALREMLADPRRTLAMGRRAARLADGLGAARVAVSITGARHLRLGLRAAAPRDEALLLDWANDPVVRAHAFHQGAISADAHHAWFAKRLADPHCLILIAEDEFGLPLGQVRFELAAESGEATIDISIDPVARGENVGSRLLAAAQTRWWDRHPGTALVAEVLDHNQASQKLFRSSGFVEVAARRPGSHTYVHAAPSGSNECQKQG